MDGREGGREEVWVGRESGGRAVAGGSPGAPCILRILSLQEPGAEKTNNGVHYRLRLVYNNGERGPLPTGYRSTM